MEKGDNTKHTLATNEEIFAETTKAKAEADPTNTGRENHTTIQTIKGITTTIKEGSHRTIRNSTKEKDVRKAKQNLPTRRAKAKAKVGEKARTIKATEVRPRSLNQK